MKIKKVKEKNISYSIFEAPEGLTRFILECPYCSYNTQLPGPPGGFECIDKCDNCKKELIWEF